MGILGGRILGIALLTLSAHAAPVACLEGLLSTSAEASQYLKDAARYFTGSEDDAVAVYQAYKKRTKVDDPTLPYPKDPPALAVPHSVADLWKLLEFEKEVFAKPLTHRWQKSESGLWSRRLVAASRVKGLARTLYRRKASPGKPALSLAVTQGRETELALARVNSPDHDFFVYDASGQLTAESTFRTSSGKDVTGPAPLTCLACHYDRSARTFGALPLSYNFGERIVEATDRGVSPPEWSELNPIP